MKYHIGRFFVVCMCFRSIEVTPISIWAGIDRQKAKKFLEVRTTICDFSKPKLVNEKILMLDSIAKKLNQEIRSFRNTSYSVQLSTI